ncbi:MAG TPA: LLM class flavin-dependent oxidoreductase [Candidatus Binataceae bacterium]|nr:LLM class flavin-dependent oxidoreductase [Candidatus Binataceae bacterium]
MRKVKLGYQFDFRNPPGSGRSFAAVYAEMFRQAERAEELGFDSLWLTEHHFTDDGYLPSMIPMAAALAARTSRVTIGTYVLLAPFHHPVKLAEDAAVTDVISNGRLRLGLGLGYRPEEFEGFGVRRNERLGRTLETIEIMRRAWTGDRFDYAGKHFNFRGVRVLPRPVSQPHPEILWGAAAPKAIERAARLDLGFACVGGRREVDVYHNALRALGKDPSRYSVVCGRIVHIAPTPERAWEEAGPAMMYQAELYAQWIAKGYGRDPNRTFIRPDPERLKRTALLGPVDRVRKRLEEVIDETPMTEFIACCQLPGLDPALAMRSLELFGREIAPALKATA